MVMLYRCCCGYIIRLHDAVGILPMLAPEEIVNSSVPDKLFMISYISQLYTTLRDKKPLGGNCASYIMLSHRFTGRSLFHRAFTV